ncbi:MAG: HAD family hydrolase [Chthoniobacteraceae bacterium]
MSFPGPIEIAPHFRPRPNLRHAIFDWDGTISLIRGGWVEVMVEVCIDSAPSLDRALVHAEMLALNGKPSIHQMVRMAELVSSAGGTPQHPEEYHRIYGERLARAAEGRVSELRAGGSPHAHTVPGAFDFLDALAARGLAISLVSGTSHPELIFEAELLGITDRFGGRIHGPRDTSDREFTKRAAIHALVASHRIGADELLAVGDGPVEMRETKALGGFAIGVASDESAPGSRRFDDFKRRQLLDCGADVVVPDYQDAAALVALITETP